MKVFKYDILVTDFFSMPLPKGAQFLSVQVQNGAVCAWFLVDPAAEPEVRMFRVHGTGHEVPNADKVKYLGTFQLYSGSFVGHLFEEV